MKTIKYFITIVSLNTFQIFSLILNPSLRSILGKLIGQLFFYVLKKRKEVAYLQLKKSFPKKTNKEIIEILKKTHTHFGQMFLDVLCSQKIIKNENIKIINEEILLSLKSNNQGFILLTGHLGNWEIIPAWMSKNKFNVKTVTQNQKNKGAQFFFNNLRKQNDINPVSIHYSSNKMINFLKNGNTLVLASDQDAGEKGEFINFFGRKASTPRGASVFYKKTKCKVIAAFCLKKKFKYSIEFIIIEPNKNYTSIMHQFTELLEKKIKGEPHQYLWFHRRWKTKNEKY
tara:strand:+ start:297 stop:1154 length:858 start_codon:yes stop_codon:yes gene_type:complete